MLVPHSVPSGCGISIFLNDSRKPRCKCFSVAWPASLVAEPVEATSIRLDNISKENGTMHFGLAPNPFGNTFGLFCASRVQSALLGNVFSAFRFPRVLPSIHWRHYFPLSLQKGYPACARRLLQHFWDAYTPLFVPRECRMALLSNVCPHFCL